MKNILLTVPHSKCLGKKDHICDYLAEKAAKSLHSKLEFSILILSDVNRTFIDYNRKKSKNTKWRENIRKIILSKNIDFLIDVHSFPPSSESFGFFKKDNETYSSLPEIVLLDSYYDEKFLDRSTSVEFNKYLLKNNIKSKLIVGGDNDITLDGRRLNIKSILIEYNESLTSQRLDYINNIIIKYIIKLSS
jgi:hypothetical protein